MTAISDAVSGNSANGTADSQELAAARQDLAAYDRRTLRCSIPGDWVEVTWTARRCGVDAEVIVSFGLWAAVQEGRMTLESMMTALAAAGAEAIGPQHNVPLATIPTTVASCVGEHDNHPVLAIKLEA